MENLSPSSGRVGSILEKERSLMSNVQTLVRLFSDHLAKLRNSHDRDVRTEVVILELLRAKRLGDKLRIEYCQRDFDKLPPEDTKRLLARRCDLNAAMNDLDVSESDDQAVASPVPYTLLEETRYAILGEFPGDATSHPMVRQTLRELELQEDREDVRTWASTHFELVTNYGSEGPSSELLVEWAKQRQHVHALIVDDGRPPLIAVRGVNVFYGTTANVVEPEAAWFLSGLICEAIGQEFDWSEYKKDRAKDKLPKLLNDLILVKQGQKAKLDLTKVRVQ
jgi:hypothetical protein